MVGGVLTRISVTSLPSLAHPAKQPEEERSGLAVDRAQGLCESRGGRPGLPVPNSPYGPFGREATLNQLINRLAVG